MHRGFGFFIFIIFPILSFGSSINQNHFENVYQSLKSLSSNNVMRQEIFDRDYGLLFEVAKNIHEFYGDNISEANTTFKDHMYYLSYLFFLKESEMTEDLHVENLSILLNNMYSAILQILKNYNWEIKYNGKSYSGDDVLSLPRFTPLKKEINYKGSSLIKIFTSSLSKIIDELIKETVLEKETIQELKAMVEQVNLIQSSNNSSDLSRKINKAARKLIDHFDVIEEHLKFQSRNLRRNGNLKALELINKVRVIVNSLKELKDYGKNYSY